MGFARGAPLGGFKMSDVSQRKPISAVLLLLSLLTSPLFGKPVALLDGNHSGNILLRKNGVFSGGRK
jgi:hypothetical protein